AFCVCCFKIIFSFYVYQQSIFLFNTLLFNFFYFFDKFSVKRRLHIFTSRNTTGIITSLILDINYDILQIKIGEFYFLSEFSFVLKITHFSLKNWVIFDRRTKFFYFIYLIISFCILVDEFCRECSHIR